MNGELYRSHSDVGSSLQNENEIDSNTSDNEIQIGNTSKSAIKAIKHNIIKHSTINQYITSKQCTISLQDLERTIGHFDGNTDVQKWFENLEEYAQLFDLKDSQKLIISKRLLRGLPKLFMESEKGRINSWLTFKQALMNEFSIKYSSAELHRMLAKRKMKPDESFHSYYLKMKELASRGTIDSEALIYYIIEGISDKAENKLLLYEAKTLDHLKEKLQIYSRSKTNLNTWDEIDETNRTESSTQNDKAVPVINSTTNGKSESVSNVSKLEDGNETRPSNNSPSSRSITLSEINSDVLQQIAAMLLPSYTADFKDMKERLTRSEDKITSIKLEVERLVQDSGRQTINIANLDRRIQLLEGNHTPSVSNSSLVKQPSYCAGIEVTDIEQNEVKVVNLENRLNILERRREAQERGITSDDSVSDN